MHFHGWPMAKVKQICGKRTAKPTQTDPTHTEVHWTEMRMSLELISSCASSRQVTWPGFKALLLHSYLMSSRTQGPQLGRLPTRNLRLTSLAPCTSGEVRWLGIPLPIMIDTKNCRSRPELDFACRLLAENWTSKTLDSSYAQNTIQWISTFTGNSKWTSNIQQYERLMWNSYSLSGARQLTLLNLSVKPPNVNM